MSEQEILDILGFCPKDSKGNSLVMFTTNIMEHNGMIFNVHNFKVCVCDKDGIVVKDKRQAYFLTDDQTYQTHPEIHKLIPRGLSVLRIVDKKTNHVVMRKITQGFFKFSALSSIDEDDEVNCDFMDKTEIKNCDQVLVTEKANGKLFLLSAFELNGENYFVGGSKNNHVVVPVDNAESYKGLNEHFSLVRDMFSVWLNVFFSLQSEQQAGILNKLKNNTFSGEFEDGKHMIPVDQKQIRWFGMMENAETEFVNTDIIKCLEWFTSQNLLTISYVLKPGPDFWENYNDGRLQRNSEGYVRHFLKDNNSIGIEKFKTYWYIVIRMLRQIILRTHSSIQAKEQVHLTLIKRNQLLQFNRAQFNFAKGFCGEFVDWFYNNGFDRKEVGHDETCSGMGNVWKRFITETGTNDDFNNIPVSAEAECVMKDKLLVIVQGVPGLGKNSIGEKVASMNPKWKSIDQDSFKGKKSGEMCFRAFKKLLTTDGVDVILLLRNNSNMSQYGKYALFAKENQWKTLALYPNEILTRQTDLILVCMNTVLGRVNHVFDKLERNLRVKLVLAFYSQFEKPSPGDLIDFVDEILWLNSSELPPTINREYLWNWYKSMKATRDVFSSSDKNFDELKDQLQLDEFSHPDFRLGKSVVEQAFTEKIIHYLTAPVESKVMIPEPNFVSIKLDDNTKQILTQLIIDMGGCDTEGKTKYLDHLTLMHSLDKRNDEKLWEKVKNLSGESIVVTVNKIYIGEGIVLGADLMYKGNDASNFIYSKVPHITSFLPKSMKPYQSINFIKENKYERIVDVEYEFEGVVYLN